MSVHREIILTSLAKVCKQHKLKEENRVLLKMLIGLRAKEIGESEKVQQNANKVGLRKDLKDSTHKEN